MGADVGQGVGDGECLDVQVDFRPFAVRRGRSRMDFVAFRVHFLDVVVPFAACACILVEPVARQTGQRQRCGVGRRIRADRQLHGAVPQERRVHVRFQRAQQRRGVAFLG